MTYADPPYLHNYYSDWAQLGFYYHEFEGWGYGAYFFHETDPYGVHEVHIMMMNLFSFKLALEQKGFEAMVQLFLALWYHEYLHLIGLTEKGVTAPKPTITVAS